MADKHTTFLWRLSWNSGSLKRPEP